MKISKTQQKHITIFKALANPHRFMIFLEILEGGKEKPVQEIDLGPGEDERCCLFTLIKKKFQLGAPTLSHHLKELKEAGLIHVEKRGKFLMCRPNEETIHFMQKFFIKGKQG